MKKIIKFSIREIFVVVLSGGLPLFVAYNIGGTKQLEILLRGLFTPSIFLYYSALLLIIFAVLYSLNKYVYISPLSEGKKWLNFIVSVFYELSSNIVGIFRVVSGVLITLPFLILVNEPESFLNFFLSFFIYGALAFVELTILYWWFSKLKIKNI